MRILSYAVVIYMLLALVWWSILLHEKNNIIYGYQLELYDLKSDPSISEEQKSLARNELLSKHNRQNTMIMGEGIVFGILLIVGIGLILKASNKEIEANKKVKDFLLSITHELKSPLASINLILDTIFKRELDRETTQELTQDAKKESHRLEKLINNILLSVRVNKAYQYNFEKTNLSQFIENIVKKYSKEHDIQFSSHLAQQNVDIDPESFYSVVSNLIENAIKYSNDNTVLIKAHDDLSSTFIEFADQGIGINEKDKKKIFEQFVRLGKESTRTSKGTGLGLYIVKKIVDAHGGNIRIENNTPKGSVFIIKLPKEKR